MQCPYLLSYYHPPPDINFGIIGLGAIIYIKCPRYDSRTLRILVNPLTPNDHYSGRTVPLTSKRYIIYIYSTNIGTEYFKHGIYSPFFFSSKCILFHNSNIFGFCFIHILYTECAKIKKKIIPTPKG